MRFTSGERLQSDFIDEAEMLRIIEEGATDPDVIVSHTWEEESA